MVDYEYILFCYNVLKSGKPIKVDLNRLEESKKQLANKDSSEFTEDDKLAIFRITYIEKRLK